MSVPGTFLRFLHCEEGYAQGYPQKLGKVKLRENEQEKWKERPSSYSTNSSFSATALT
jgi:hypothetical protein